jgi:hypothetical protein
MQSVAKHRPSGPPPEAEGDKSGGRSGENLNVWVQSQIARRLRAYLASTDPRVSKTSAVESALISFLEDKGFWPPPAGSG